MMGRECNRFVWWDRYITVGKVWSECDMLVWSVWDMMMRDADMLVRKKWTCWWRGGIQFAGKWDTLMRGWT